MKELLTALLWELEKDSVPLLQPEMVAPCVLPPVTALLPLTLPLREAEGQAEEEKVTVPVRLTAPTVGVRTALAVGLTVMERVGEPVAAAEVEAV